jgi:photosystem II stability/assembly factor-like uncharacterized protein
LPNVLNTQDGGKTWQQGSATNPAGVYLSSITFVWRPGKDSMVAVGIAGALISDGGSPWTKENTDNLNSAATPGGRVEVVWAVGPKGTVLESKRKKTGSAVSLADHPITR